MFFTILLLSIYIFAKTIGYAIYEYRENSNKASAIIIGILSTISLIAPPIITILQ